MLSLNKYIWYGIRWPQLRGPLAAALISENFEIVASHQKVDRIIISEEYLIRLEKAMIESHSRNFILTKPVFVDDLRKDIERSVNSARFLLKKSVNNDIAYTPEVTYTLDPGDRSETYKEILMAADTYLNNLRNNNFFSCIFRQSFVPPQFRDQQRIMSAASSLECQNITYNPIWLDNWKGRLTLLEQVKRLGTFSDVSKNLLDAFFEDIEYSARRAAE